MRHLGIYKSSTNVTLTCVERRSGSNLGSLQSSPHGLACSQAYGFQLSSSTGGKRTLYCTSVEERDSWIWYIARLFEGEVSFTAIKASQRSVQSFC